MIIVLRFAVYFTLTTMHVVWYLLMVYIVDSTIMIVVCEVYKSINISPIPVYIGRVSFRGTPRF